MHARILPLVSSLVLAVGAASLDAQANLIKDINAAAGAGPSDPPAGSVVPFDNGLMYAKGGPAGEELWFTDGTAAGTRLVKDINPGVAGSRPLELVVVGGVVYFIADDGVHGRELWRSDGTPPGTVLLSDTVPGPISGLGDLNDNPTQSGGGGLTPVGSVLFFFVRIGNDPNLGVDGDLDLWTSDGTAAGTGKVTEVFQNDVITRPYPFFKSDRAAANSLFFFVVPGGFPTPDSLFRSDGTVAGTFPVQSGGPVSLFGTATGLFFVNSGLWFTDGTIPNTIQLHPGLQMSGPVSIGSEIVFAGFEPTLGSELWKSDGTPAGTVLVRDIRPGASSSFPDSLVAVGGTVYFSADDGAVGNELWRSDGTSAGTGLVADILPGPGSGTGLVAADPNGVLLLSGNDGATGVELWKSDGTAIGTALVKDIWPGPMASFPGGFVNSTIRSFFNAQASGSSGLEFWVSDGTASGTTPLGVAGGGDPSSFPVSLVPFQGDLFFFAVATGVGRSLWRSDGSTTGTSLVRSFNLGLSLSDELTPFQGALFFQVDDGQGPELWKSDGTTAGTVPVKDIWPGVLGSRPADFTPTSGALFFTADDGANGRELWKTDGTTAGTVRVVDLLAGFEGSEPRNLAALGASVVFSANDVTHGRELWVSDGTAGGTILLGDVYAGATSSNPTELTLFGGEIFFAASDGTSGRELWKTDGTVAGTVRVTDLAPGLEDADPESLRVLGAELFFVATVRNVVGRELWKTDGSTAGTGLAADVNPGAASSNPFEIVAGGGALWFAADGGTGSAFQLWRSQGTQATTQLVKVINPSGSSFPRSLRFLRQRLLFSADDGSSGFELWVSDGTATGTQRLQDIWPGIGSSDPDQFVDRKGLIVFTADDGTIGRELWGLPSTAVFGATSEVLGVACAGNTTPQIGAIGAPQLGTQSFFVSLSQAPANTQAALLVGLDGPPIPVFPGCFLYPQFPALATLSVGVDGSGIGQGRVPIPNILNLTATPFVAQYLVLDPGAPFLNLLSLTPALRFWPGG